MTVRQMPFEELELLSYQDIAYELLKLDKTSKTTPELFGEVCDLLSITKDNMLEMIGDFYTTLTTDKRFILLDNAEWDLKEFHSVKLVVDDEDEDEANDNSLEQDIVEGTEDDAVTQNSDEYEDDDNIDDLEDLEIISEEDMEE